jgi:hypothetical protein
MLTGRFCRRLGAVLIALAGITFAGAAQATAVLTSVRGDVRTVAVSRPLSPVALNEQLDLGTTVLTGSESQAVIKFDDGQVVVLDQNTSFRLDDFSYDAAKPAAGRVVVDLLKGALRIVTGSIGRANHEAFALRVPQGTIGIHGTDFMVVLDNATYTSVLQGSIYATTGAGTTVFGSGSIGSIPSDSALGAVIPASALPSAASAAFADLSAARGIVAGGAAGGASGGGTAASGEGVSSGAIAAGILGAIAVGAAAGGGGGGGTSTTVHH